MELSAVRFIMRDSVDGYFMIYDGACGTTKLEAHASVFEMRFADGEFYVFPEIPKPFLNDPTHAWRPVAVTLKAQT